MNLPTQHVLVAFDIARQREAEFRRRHLEWELRRGRPADPGVRGRLARVAAAVARGAGNLATRLDPDGQTA
jgi:hypothetical protein